MRNRIILFLITFTFLLMGVACDSVNIDNYDDGSNDVSNNAEGNQDDIISNDLKENDVEEEGLTEKSLLESLLKEANKYTNRILKDESFTIGIDEFGNYELYSYTSEAEEDDEVEINLMFSPGEVEFEKDEEDYELPNGLKGTLGDLGYGYIGFVHYGDNEMTTEVELGQIEIEDAKIKLDALEFRDEALTETDIRDLLGFYLEDIKFFDNSGTNYDVLRLWISKENPNTLTVRYYNHDADEYDAIDIDVSKKEFDIPNYIDTENTTTKNGKEVKIVDDGLFVKWLWEEDGYFYKISGNYGEEDVEKKEYNLVVIDNMVKKFGE